MFRWFAPFILMLIFASDLLAQKVVCNFDVNPEWGSFEEVIEVWTRYLESPTDSAGAQYWNKAEVEQYGRENYFLLNSEYNPNLLQMAKIYRAQILSITERDSLYKITTQFYYPRNDTLLTLCIIEVYAKENGDSYKLYNALPINLQRSWSSETVGFIRYHYPKYHEFDRAKALRQNAFITETLSGIFGTEPDTVDYFFAETQQELNSLRGFVFNVGGSGTEKPTGKTAPGNIVYAVGTGEYYPHELVHVFVNSLFPDMYSWASEGLATYLGGSRGQPLHWHVKRTNVHLQEHPEIDLTNMLDLITLDEYTDYRYVLGGSVIQLVHDKKGWEGVKSFLRQAKDKDSYYAALENHLGWQRKEINEEFRRSLQVLAAD